MDKAKLELIVGTFVLVGIVCLGYLSIKLGKLELIGGNLYELDAEFTSASGLKPGAAVEIGAELKCFACASHARSNDHGCRAGGRITEIIRAAKRSQRIRIEIV